MAGRWKAFASRILIGVLVIVTMPIWWAAIAIALVVAIVVMTLHALGDGVLKTAQPFIDRMRARS